MIAYVAFVAVANLLLGMLLARIIHRPGSLARGISGAATALGSERSAAVAIASGAASTAKTTADGKMARVGMISGPPEEIEHRRLGRSATGYLRPAALCSRSASQGLSWINAATNHQVLGGNGGFVRTQELRAIPCQAGMRGMLASNRCV